MQPPAPARRARPVVGEVEDIRCHAQVMCGVKAFYPNANIINGKDATLVVDEELRCVWIGWSDRPAKEDSDLFWARVGWDGIAYCRYKQPKP